jgi:hypothetical protein
VHATATPNTQVALSKQQLLHPKRKYYGISLAGAPRSMAPIRKVTTEVGKKPSLALFFEAWGPANHPTPVDTTPITNACHAGILPMLAWESWNPPSYTQPAYSLHAIASGTYDRYIRASAAAIAATHCPVALRLDGEFNGFWYPWGHTTAGMHNTYRGFRLMWRHVWSIFRAQGATHVLWVWAPNFVTKANRSVSLKKLYPGGAYVDWVGIDGYYTHPTSTFSRMFRLTIQELTNIAPKKPWMLSETGVGSSVGAQKPALISNLLASVAADKRFNGFVYFDQHKSSDRSDWRFDATVPSDSLSAFKSGVGRQVYMGGRTGRYG